MKLWGGRFRKEENKLMEDFNSSLKVDKRLYSEDIKGSIAHVNMLVQCDLLTKKEGEDLVKSLLSILEDIENGTLPIEGNFEDIHSFVEVNLTERIGDTAKKLHTARSRNDQVATDIRLYAKNKALEVIKSIEDLQNSLEKKQKKIM
ncbi:hypothetical protein MGI18_08375 [Bacillus sp. OVS6]|nr:hypothetical protein MGI18_08375 [Bacillus sp. OVS6]